MATMKQLRDATINARHLAQDQSIGTRVQDGRIQVIRATYSNGKTHIDELSEWLSADAALTFLIDMVAL